MPCADRSVSRPRCALSATRTVEPAPEPTKPMPIARAWVSRSHSTGLTNSSRYTHARSPPGTAGPAARCRAPNWQNQRCCSTSRSRRPRSWAMFDQVTLLRVQPRAERTTGRTPSRYSPRPTSPCPRPAVASRLVAAREVGPFHLSGVCGVSSRSSNCNPNPAPRAGTARGAFPCLTRPRRASRHGSVPVSIPRASSVSSIGIGRSCHTAPTQHRHPDAWQPDRRNSREQQRCRELHEGEPVRHRASASHRRVDRRDRSRELWQQHRCITLDLVLHGRGHVRTPRAGCRAGAGRLGWMCSFLRHVRGAAGCGARLETSRAVASSLTTPTRPRTERSLSASTSAPSPRSAAPTGRWVMCSRCALPPGCVRAAQHARRDRLLRPVQGARKDTTNRTRTSTTSAPGRSSAPAPTTRRPRSHGRADRRPRGSRPTRGPSTLRRRRC